MTQDVRVRGWLRRFGVAQALLDVQFWFPLWLIFLLDRGFSFAEAALADGIFRIAVVVLELPMGALADRIGRQRAYLILCGLTCLTYAGIVMVTNVPLLLAVWLLWAAQWALASGLGAAVGYDLAALVPDRTTRRRTFSRLRGASAAGVLVSLATAGLLYQVHPSAPFLLSAVLALVAGGIASGIPRLSGRSAMGGSLRATLGWVRETLARRRTRVVFLMAAGYLLITWSIQVLHQPIALGVGLGPNLTAWMFTACAAAGMIGTLAAARWAHESAWPAQVACGAMVALLCLATGVWPHLAPWVFLPALALVAAFGWTLTEYSVTDAVDVRFRSTALSLVSAIGGIGIAVARPVLLVGADSAGPAAAAAWWGWAALALTVLLGLGALVLRRGRAQGTHIRKR